jgi:hypothetical protein
MRSEPEQTSAQPGRLTRLLSGLASLRHDPASLRYALPLARSLLTDRTALEDGVPWLTFRATKWLQSYLQPEMRVFEYGSGGSTIFLSRRIQELVSVEHDPEWYSKTEQALKEVGVGNSTYLLREPQVGTGSSFGSTDPAYSGMHFEAYVKSIDAYPDAAFDLVSVDGRARTACAIHAVQKVKSGGYLLLDDADRPDYREAVEALSPYPRLDFRGSVPYSTTLGTTSVWRIERS